MVICFSGTGNSRYIAKKVSASLNDELIDVTNNVNEGAVFYDDDKKPCVFVCPTYAWRIPKVFEKHINKATFASENKKPINVYFLLTCGGDIGNAEKYIKSLCKKKGFNLLGVAEIVMPENYVAMFSVPSEKTSRKIIYKADSQLIDITDKIRSLQQLPSKKINFLDKRKSDIVNLTFYPFCVSADKFRVTNKCISCKKCIELCPLKNIQLIDGKPVWGKNCTHCMACICLCPTEAIEYGRKTESKRRYKFPDSL